MATLGQGASESASAEFNQNQAESTTQYEGPSFENEASNQVPVEQASSEPPSPVSNIVDNATGISTQETGRSTVTTEPASRVAETRSVVSNAQNNPASTIVGGVIANQGSVPIVPQDRNLAPGLSSGRVTTQGGGYTPQQGGANLRSSNLEGAAYEGAQQAQQQQSQPAQQAQQQQAEEVDLTSESANYSESKQRYREDERREAIRKAGQLDAPEPANMLSRANRRFRKTKEAIQERIKGKLSGKGRKGYNAFQDTIFSLSTIWPDCVSIGSENLLDALRDPGSNIIDVVSKATGVQLDRQMCIDDIRLLVNAINSVNIEVTFSKSPVNTKTSIQVRTLRAHYGRGIGLHPTQTKSYNADFDGDTGNLNLDQKNIRNHSRAMTHLIDAEGNPTIDPDFFPLDYMAMPTSRERDELIESMQERNFSWNPSVATKIADAYIDACNDGNWVGLLRAIDKIAGDENLQLEQNLSRGRLTARILKSIYDYAIDRRGYNLRLEWASVIDSYEYTDPDPDTPPIVMSLIDMVDAISKGQPAPNFQDFTVFFNKQYGDLHGESVKGKNVPFRLLADFAKAIKRSDIITVGDYTWGIDSKGNINENATVTIYDLWQFTCSAGVSKLISGRLHMGSHELAVSTQVKSKILDILSRKYGSPIPQWYTETATMTAEQAEEENKKLFREWMKDFRKHYNSQMRMLNVSQVSFRGGMRIARDKNLGKYDGFDEFTDDGFGKAFVDVFGDYTVGRVFPDSMLGYGRKLADNRENTNEGVITRYERMTITDFAIHNRIDWYSEGVDKEDNSLKKIPEMNKRYANGTFYPMDVLMTIADRRSKQFGDYEESWMKATGKHAAIMARIRDDIANDDFNSYAYDMLEFIHLMSPRMFDHFGMDSPITFAKSKWGKRLMENQSPSEFRSTLVSMMIEYRLNHVSKLLTRMNDLSEEVYVRPNYHERIEAMDAEYVCELQALASSSMAWESIVSEMTGDTNAFQKLLQIKENVMIRGNNKYELYAADFWSSNTVETQYSLLNFLKSSADYETKINVLCDVVRWNTGIYNSIFPANMIGMLAHNPDPLFAGSKFEMDNGISSATDAVKDSINKITSYKSKAPSKIKKTADRIITEARENKAAFEAKLMRFATDPGYYIHVDTAFAADAISSIYEKAYADSEKIKQQTLVNGYFECVSLQRNGGFYTHLQQTDNAVVNVIGFDQLTNLDIVRILGDPSIELHGYDEFGVPCVYSRESLCGGNTIDDVLDYLEEHPRVALACRRHMVGINDDPDGSARLSVLDDARAGDSHSNRVFSLLNDRPRFLAIAALITPTKGNVARNLAENVNENIRNLCLFIMDEAASGKNVSQIKLDIEDFFGIADGDSFESLIIRLRNEGAFDELEFGIDDYTAARNMFTDVTSEIIDCIGIVQESGIAVRSIPADAIKHEKIGIDKSSMVAYYDARQQLNGARTAKMIYIEGGETKKNLVLKEFVRQRPDRFMTVTSDMSREAIFALSKRTERDIQAELDASEDGMLVIEVPAGWNIEDLTLEHDQRKQVGSISKFLEVKREKGAETFNAKSKKFGDDGSNSIIKFFKYGTRRMFGRYGKEKQWSVEDSRDLRKMIEGAGSKDAAIPILAEALIQADKRLGYVDINKTFQKSDYYNRADLMLTEVQNEDGTVSIYIRTLEQLAVAFRNRISDEAMVSEKANVVMQELVQLADVVGTPKDPMFNADVNKAMFDDVRIISGVGSIGRLERALRPYSSSVERNYNLVWKLFTQFGKDEFGDAAYEMPSRKAIVEISNTMFAKLNKATAEALKGVAYPNDKWVPATQTDNGDWIKGHYKQDPEGSRQYVYDYLGRPQDEGFQLIPGPQSLVYIDDNQHIEDIEKCKEYGITVAFTDMSNVPYKYIEDAIIIQDGVVILPFFDMRLNGSVADAVTPAPGMFPFKENNMMICAEDTTYEIDPGDASCSSTQEGLDKAHINLDGDELFDAFDLFPNILRVNTGEFVDQRTEMYRDVEDQIPNDQVYQMRLATREEVERWVLSGEGTIDYGVHESNSLFNRERRRYEIRLREYAKQFEAGNVDKNSMLVGDIDTRYDSIVGFVKLEMGVNQFVFAPIIPFHLESSGRAFGKFKTSSKKPSQFRIESFELEDDLTSYHMRWRFTGDIKNQYIKFFEGIGASNKLMVRGEPIRSRYLANGLAVDMLYSTKSVASRLFPTNKRIHTLITMMMIPRIDPNYAYNFAELAGSFPKESDNDAYNADVDFIVTGLRTGTLTREDWAGFVQRWPNAKYHNDSEINSVVKWLVEKCVKPGVGYQTVNPTYLLATKTDSAIMVPIATEFEAFMDSGYNFQNALMHLMNAMCPTLVPESIDGDSSNTLMKPVRKDSTSDDYGCLQMMVPHWTKFDDKYYEVAENVYISFSFFGDEFSGFKRVNFDASNRGIDDLNVSAQLDGFDLSQVMSFARAGMAKVPSMSTLEMSEDNIMEKVEIGQDTVEVRNPKITERILGPSWGKVLILTGHRPQDLWGFDPNDNYDKVAEKLKEYCIENDIDTIVSGMALGFDQIGAEVALELDLNLVAAVPFEGQEEAWQRYPERVEHYRDILEQADFVVYVSPKLQDKKDKAEVTKKMTDRNKWMVNNGDEVFALWNGKENGGTWNTVKYARKRKPLHTLNPFSVEVEVMQGASKNDLESEEEPEVIDSFRGEYEFLSNMYNSDVESDIWRYRNLEAAFQAHKLYYLKGKIYDDWEQAMEDFEQASGKEARILGRKLKDLDVEAWNKKKYDIMKMLVRAKFDPEFHPDMASKLLATGNAELIEGNTWGDTYWGVSNGVGENNLGKILMEVRDELREVGD